MPGKTKTAVRCCYWGYKIFQAARLCAGDYTALVELLSEGCAELAAEEALSVAIEACELAKHTSDVGKFTGNLSSELATYDSAAEAAASMEEANNAYELFVACDTDGDGQISIAEFINFVSMLGGTKNDALEMFALLDTDGNGQLSFEEWVLLPEKLDQGDDPDAFSLNCPGLHGLTPFKTPIDGYRCDKCRGQALRGAKMLSCRRCEYDVCLDCAASALKSQARCVDCPGRHGIAVFKTPTGSYYCDVCRGGVAEGGSMRGCRLCNHDVCTSCVPKEYHLYRLFCSSPSSHELVVDTTPNCTFSSCNNCRNEVREGEQTFACRECNYDVCMECVVDSARL